MTSGNIVSGAFNTPPAYSKKTWSGVDTPKGQPRHAENNYDMTACSYAYALTDRYLRGSFYDSRFLYSTLTNVPGLPSDTLEAKALSKLKDKIQGGDFSAGVFLGTLDEVLPMVTSRCRSVIAALTAVRQRRYADALRVLAPGTGRPLRATAPADVWLELQYGWIPLLNDVYEGMEKLHNMREERSMSYKASAWSVVQTEDSASVPNYSITLVTRQWVSYRWTLNEELSTSQKLFSLTTPAEILWERMPWSFVVDWFIPVGTYLENLGFVPKLSGSGGVSRFSRCFPRINRTYKDNAVWQYKNQFDPPVRGSGVRLQRRALTASTITVPLPELKSISQAMGVQRCRNAAALIWQQINKFGRTRF